MRSGDSLSAVQAAAMSLGLGKLRSLRQRHDLDARARKLVSDLKVERPVPGHEHAASGRDAVRAQQGLGGAGGHETRKRPSGDRQAAFVGAGGDHELFGLEELREAVGENGDLLRPERAPNQRLAEHLDALGPDHLDQVPAGAELLVHRALAGKGVGLGQLLVKLAAERRPLVDEHDLGARRRGRIGRRQARRPAADHEHVGPVHRHFAARRLREVRHVRARNRARVLLDFDAHAAAHPRHAGADILLAVDADQAFVAHPHPAKDAALRAVLGLAKSEFAGRRQACRDRFARVPL